MSLILATADEFLRLAKESATTLTKMQLQKLVYYAQAWSLALRQSELVDDDFQAWINGPVNPALWSHFRHVVGRDLPPTDGDHLWLLSPEAKRLIAAVWEAYGEKDGLELSDLTHAEMPWRTARGDTPDGVNSTEVVDTELMARFYSRHERPEAIRRYEEAILREEEEATAKIEAARAANGGRFVTRLKRPASV